MYTSKYKCGGFSSMSSLGSGVPTKTMEKHRRRGDTEGRGIEDRRCLERR